MSNQAPTTKLTPFGHVSSEHVVAAALKFGNPLFLYDEALIVERCRSLLSMPNAFGYEVRYAMKANPSRAILEIIAGQGLGIDASSLNEARRAHVAGVPYERIMLTTQDVPLGEDRTALQGMLLEGMTYNICSLRQLELALPFLEQQSVRIALRINPGVGTGESVTRNTGDKYSSFGIHLAQLEQVHQLLLPAKLRLEHVHAHIGSGGDPQVWRNNIDRMLQLTEQHFPDATTVNLGGGFKEARMPEEVAADINDLGAYAKRRFEEFRARTGRALRMAIEPGTYVVANSGYLITQVLDIKSSGPDGFEFIVLNAGMEASTRPLLYGSRHPFYVIGSNGQLRSSEFNLDLVDAKLDSRVIVGRCCESGDSQTLDEHGHVVPRTMVAPQIGDYIVIGGVGAYCSAMSLGNYNSYLQLPEVLLKSGGGLALIRRRQTFEQMLANELGLDE